jgi:hypothetical protein
MSGLMDWIRPKKRPESKDIIYIGPGGEARTGLPAVRREESKPPIPFRPKETFQEKLLSIFDVMGPETPKLQDLAERFDILPGEVQRPLQELAPAGEETEKELFREFFEESKETPPEEIFERFTAADAPLFEIPKDPLWRVEPGEAPPESEDWPTGEPPLYWWTNWRLPSKFEVAHWIQNRPDKWDLPGIFEFTMQETDYPGWKKLVEESAHFGKPAIIEVELLAKSATAYEDFGNLLEIPQVVLDSYFSDIVTTAQGIEAAQLFELEVLSPFLERISIAFDALRPRALRGWFEISPASDDNWWLSYKEARFRS